MTASAQTLMPTAALLTTGEIAHPPTASSSSSANILPFGDTLHYAGCGCPNWQKGGRVADQVDALVARFHRLFQRKLISPNRPLRVCYMLPHHNITGGMKCLVEHIRLLRQRGHYTIAVHRSDTAKRAMPPWTTVEADADVVCNLHQRLSDVYPVHDIDVVVVGIFHQVGCSRRRTSTCSSCPASSTPGKLPVSPGLVAAVLCIPLRLGLPQPASHLALAIPKLVLCSCLRTEVAHHTRQQFTTS